MTAAASASAAASAIYNQHAAAFANVSAYVVMSGAERVATIAFKYPRDGAGRLYAYVHWIGSEMVRSFAVGGGYDKHTAACAHAARRLIMPKGPENMAFQTAACSRFLVALCADDGHRWSDQLRRAGFDVFQAV